MRLFIAACLLALFFINSESSLKKVCRDLQFKTEQNYYHPLRHCQRSNKTVIAQYNDFDTVEECANFARKSRGLAFNYSPKSRRSNNFYENETTNNNPLFQEDFNSCEVLECPEKINLSSIVNDTRFDYYSLYAYPIRKFGIKI